MKLISKTTLFLTGIACIIFEEVAKSIEEASIAVDKKRVNVNQRIAYSSLKRQAITKP